MTEHLETVIIGAGQAGLATAYHLQRCGRSSLILDGNARVGDNWRTHWDSLRLYSPTGSDGLPGMKFPGPKWSYPTKDQVADYLEAYAERFALPVRNRARVERMEFVHGRYALRLGPETITADNVVVATGTFGRTPNVPEFALDLDPSIRQLHSSEYRRPDQLRPGPVLVVGASHSGTDIAFEVAPSHPTILSGRDLGALPVRLDHWSARVFWPVFLFMGTHVLTRKTPIGRKEMDEIRFHGGPALRHKPADLIERGVERDLERVTGVRNGRPVLGDREVDVTNVVWCTGFRQVFEWIDLPVFGADGWPREYRGVVAEAPGLFFCGLAMQYAFSSMVLPGVGRDAAYVADRISQRSERNSLAA
jgi:putative flavoprotein involved in K+ transport